MDRDYLKRNTSIRNNNDNHNFQEQQQVDTLFKETKETETIRALELLTEQEQQLDSQKTKLISHLLVKAREILQFQFSFSQRFLVLIQVYIQLKNKYTDQGEMQKHRDYNLSKIDKIKLIEEKHVKKQHKHFSRIVVDDDNDYEEEMNQQVIILQSYVII